MNLLRRQFLQLAAGAVAAPAVARRAFADAYPSRPVRLIVGFTPAGGNDIVARLMGQWLTERLGQTFVIENRPGAGTNIAAELVIKSPPDGYTLFITNLSNAINATLYEKLNFDFMRDMLPVAGIAQAPAVFAINSSVPAKTVTEFIAHAKANPGRINMGSAGIGSTGHLAGELFKMMAGVNLIHVPYRGNAPALTDLMGGQIEVLFPSLGSSIEYVKTGKLRALAVTGDTRSDALPDLRTVAETLPGDAERSARLMSASGTGAGWMEPWPARCAPGDGVAISAACQAGHVKGAGKISPCPTCVWRCVSSTPLWENWTAMPSASLTAWRASRRKGPTWPPFPSSPSPATRPKISC